jgi:hypothetical protein
MERFQDRRALRNRLAQHPTARFELGVDRTREVQVSVGIFVRGNPDFEDAWCTAIRCSGYAFRVRLEAYW